MVAGINYDQKSQSVKAVYAWEHDFKNAEVHGISGAPLEIVLTELPPKKALTIVIFAGYNNIKHVEQSEESIANRYSQLLTRARQLSDKVICIGVPPMVHSKSDSWYPEGANITNIRILDVDARIHQLCGAHYIDTPSFWADSDSDDGIHPNPHGYKKIVDHTKIMMALKWNVPGF